MAQKGKGGFLFISHSHKDMDKVRQLRNKLEEEGFEPLCFYLKALDDSRELDDLIKREIDARQWFVYADSKNSRKSQWVQKECSWRTRRESKNKQMLIWDLESGKPVEEFTRTLIDALRVNLIYSQKDADFVNELKNRLMEKDLQVSELTDSQSVDFSKDNYDEATDIIILSKNSAKSEFIENQVRAMFDNHTPFIPVYIDDVKLEGRLMLYLSGIQAIMNTDESNSDVYAEKIVYEISRALERKF